MKIKVECASCCKQLTEKDIFQQVVGGTTTIKIGPCHNIDCYDCSECEELQELKNKIKELEGSLTTIRNELDDSAKPAQPEKFESHELKGTKDKLRVNLQPTEDIVSTGGTIIPGIKKGSAKGTQADYTRLK